MSIVMGHVPGASLYDLLAEYSQGDPKRLRRYQKKLAEKQAAYEQKRQNYAVAKQFANHFFEERKKIREIASKALDRAIANGDAGIVEIVLKFIEEDYSQAFFEEVDRICEIGG